MGYEEVIGHLGEFGKYQKQIYLLLCLPVISCALHKLAGVFLLSRPDFRCVLPFENETKRFDSFPKDHWHLAYPYDTITGKWQTCEYYDVDYSEDYLSGTSPAAANGTVLCDTYAYDQFEDKTSAVTEWDMVCSRGSLAATSDSLFMLGVLIGSIVFGQLSDKYGRKPTFFVCLVIQVVFGVLAGVAPEYFTYTASRMIVGATSSGMFLVTYVIATEMVGPSYRLLASVVVQTFFSIGFMLTAGFAYFIHDWRWMQIALSLPGLLFMCYYWIIPESPRWLLLKGRMSEAIAIFDKAAHVNKVTIPSAVYDNLTNENTEAKEQQARNPSEKSPSVFDLLKYPNLRRKTLIIFFDWFAINGTYYGLSWNTNNLGGNVVFNFLISGAVEIPAYIFLLLTLNRWGRRTILCGSMLVAGSFLLLTIIVPSDVNWLIITCAMMGKFAITASYATIYIFSVELFPTVIRNAGLGASSMVGRGGSILAPYLNLLGEIWRPLPLIICGALVFIGGLLSLKLRETLNQPMPETIADIEKFGKNEHAANLAESGEELECIIHKQKPMHVNGKKM